MQTLMVCGAVVAIIGALAYFCAPALVWTLAAALGLLAAGFSGCLPPVALAQSAT